MKQQSDLKPFEHGEEGTHYACNTRIKNEGGKARCCGCVPHKGCDNQKPVDHVNPNCKDPKNCKPHRETGDVNYEKLAEENKCMCKGQITGKFSTHNERVCIIGGEIQKPVRVCSCSSDGQYCGIEPNCPGCEICHKKPAEDKFAKDIMELTSVDIANSVEKSTPNTLKESWEEELLERLNLAGSIPTTSNEEWSRNVMNSISNFIKSLLSQTREEVIEEILEKLPKKKEDLQGNGDWKRQLDRLEVMGFNECLEAVKKLLKESLQ